MEIQTVGDICEVIAQNLNSENKELANHAKTLLGPRRRGSTTELPLSSVPKNTKVEVLDTPQVKGATCYVFECPKLKGQLGAVSLLTLQTLGFSRWIKEREGDHGTELFLDHPWGIEQNHPEERISVIVGEFKGEIAVFTWHPGYPLAPYKGGWNDHPEGVDPMTGVKLM